MDIFQKYKKLFLILGFLSICLLLGYFIYSIFFASTMPGNVPEKQVETPNGQNGSLPNAGPGNGTSSTAIDNYGIVTDESFPQNQASPIAEGGLTKTEKLNSSASKSPTLSAKGDSVQYYNPDDGKFYSTDKNGNITEYSDKVFYNASNITWADSKDKAIIEYPDGSNVVYNFATKKQITLPNHWKDFDFSSDSSQIVMKSIGLDQDNRWLAVANDDGSVVKALEALGDKDKTVHPAWSPNGQIAAMFTESRDFDRQEVYFVGLNKENFKSTIIEGRGFQPQWSPTGEKLLYSVYSSSNDLKPTLWLVSASGDSIGSNRKTLGLDTWAEKCSYAGEKDLYCAVPKNLPEGAGLFPELASETSDNLYRIDTKTGVKKLIAIPDGDYNISQVIVSEDGNNLFFTDSKTENIYKIKLK